MWYRTAALFLLLSSVPAAAAEIEAPAALDEVTITATRTPRKVEEATATTDVATREDIQATRGSNVGEALRELPGVQAESSNGAYDTHIIIRGAGAKALYGVREIKIMVDGVPITDPDSLTRLDMVDTALIERIEVVKGPNSTLYGANAAGGVINIITKNPFDDPGLSVKLDYGSDNTQGYHVGYAGSTGRLGYLLSGSRRSTDSWREGNEFSTNQFNGRLSWMISDLSDLELSLSYTEADLELPGKLTKEQFDADPTQRTSEWANMGRDSEVERVGLSWRREFAGGREFKAQLYAQQWEHYHPVVTFINDGGATVFGADLQHDLPLAFAGAKHLLSVGLSAQRDDRDTRAYAYRDLVTATVNGKTVAVPPYTSSDAAGALAEVSRNAVDSWGVFVQDSLRIGAGTLVDVGLRYDQVRFDIDSEIHQEWAYVTSRNGVSYFNYRDHREDIAFEKTWEAWSPRIGVNQALSESLHAYGAIATGFQTPTQSEIESNHDLEPQDSLNYEVGLKGRFASGTRFDLALFLTKIEDEVVRLMDAQGATVYDNAGRTRHLGAEISFEQALPAHFAVEANYSYSDFTFEDFDEAERSGYPAKTVLVSRDGNELPLSPRHKYVTALRYAPPGGFTARLSTVTWGRYFVDTANTETYGGFTTVNGRVGYERGHYGGFVAVDNIFDRKYAAEVTKNYGKTGYAPGAPLTWIVGVTARF
jgi:iron complex outermembrane receptor protein